MIQMTFQQGREIRFVRVEGNLIFFGQPYGGHMRWGRLEGLQMSIHGILKEFPDLEGKSPHVMRREALQRLKEKINKFNNEDEVSDYVIAELKTQGFCLKRKDVR